MDAMRAGRLPDCRVLVSSDSDAVVTLEDAMRLPAGVRWFANNVTCPHSMLFPTPIGFPSNGRRDEWAAVMAEPAPDRDIKVLCLFTVDRPNREAMRRRWEHVADCVVLGGVSKYDVASRDYYRLLRRSRAVLCPGGAGPDTHRWWESLACGAEPVPDTEHQRASACRWWTDWEVACRTIPQLIAAAA
jgi:hypothetical protein